MVSKIGLILLVLNVANSVSLDQDFCQLMPNEERNYLKWANNLPTLVNRDENGKTCWSSNVTWTVSGQHFCPVIVRLFVQIPKLFDISFQLGLTTSL